MSTHKYEANNDRVTSAISKAILDVIDQIETRDDIKVLRWEKSSVGWSNIKERWLIDLLPTEKDHSKLILDYHKIDKLEESGKVKFHFPKRVLSILSKANTNYHIRYTTLYPLILKELEQFAHLSLDEILKKYGGEYEFKRACEQKTLNLDPKAGGKIIEDLIYGLEKQKTNPREKEYQLPKEQEIKFNEILEKHKWNLFDYKGCYFNRIKRGIRKMEIKGAEREMVVATYLATQLNNNPKINGIFVQCACNGDQRDMIKGIDLKIIYDIQTKEGLKTNKMTVQVKPTQIRNKFELSPISEGSQYIKVPSVGMIKHYPSRDISHLAFIFNSRGTKYIFLVKNKGIELTQSRDAYLIPITSFSKNLQEQIGNSL